MYGNKPSVLGLLDKLRVERGSHDSHIYMVPPRPVLPKMKKFFIMRDPSDSNFPEGKPRSEEIIPP